MDIKRVNPVYRVRKVEDLPNLERPRFAFAGRSNTGKSSLINRLLQRKKLAAVSKTPGKTRVIQFFLINDLFYVVDLPGFGYASVSRDLGRSIQDLLQAFLQKTPPTRFFLLFDIRRDHLPEEEREIIEGCQRAGIPVTLLLTKNDKLKKGQRARAVDQMKKNLPGDIECFSISSKEGEGIKKIWQIISHDIN